MNIDRTFRIVAIILTAYTFGVFTTVKYYQVTGLWGTRNELHHLAAEATKACEQNADLAIVSVFGGAPSDAANALDDLKTCPKPPPK